jgi:hypothetical protein
VFWAAHVSNSHSVLLDSIDTDVMPLVMHYLSSVQPPHAKRFLWRYWHSKYVDMKRLARAMERQLEWTSFEFMVAFILCGTDYFEKSEVFSRVGHKMIFHAVQACANHVAPITEDVRHFEVVLRFIYNDFMTPAGERRQAGTNTSGKLAVSTRPPPLDELRARAQGRYKSFAVATPAQIQTAYDTLKWHLNYWQIDCNAIPRRVPLPAAPVVAATPAKAVTVATKAQRAAFQSPPPPPSQTPPSAPAAKRRLLPSASSTASAGPAAAAAPASSSSPSPKKKMKPAEPSSLSQSAAAPGAAPKTHRPPPALV